MSTTLPSAGNPTLCTCNEDKYSTIYTTVYVCHINGPSLRALNPDKLVSLLLTLPADKQLDILKQLQNKLSDEGHLSG